MKLKFLLLCTFLTILLTTITPATATVGSLEITDLSNVTNNFTNQQLTEMPKTTINAELYCYGNLVACGDWSGVQLNYLLTQTNDNSEVKSIQLVASDGYTVTIPFQLAMAPETVIAYQKDGELLTGLRLVLPGVNGASWIAQIVSITMRNTQVDEPAAAAGPGGRGNLIASIIENKQSPISPPTPTVTPEQTQPTQQPTPDNSSPNPTVPLANTTEVAPTPKQQTADNQSIMLVSGTVGVIAAVFAVGLAIAGIITFKLRTNLKDIPPHSN
jgi:DMSO/TMAO reductase YedYZ molybdopterin-dependent catalytic subunit